MVEFQRTIQREVTCRGIGLHTGEEVSVVLCPAEPDSGIRFRRMLPTGTVEIEARIDRVSETTLATTLMQHGAEVGTVEHLLAAITGLGIDNLVIELDAPEVPIVDGSARPFVEALMRAGIVDQAAPQAVASITERIEVRDGEGWIIAEPAPQLEVISTVDYDHPAIGRQSFVYTDDRGTFIRELAGARTFGFLQDVERLKADGLIRGGSMENAVVVGPEGVLNPGGLRWSDEFVRHKTLDLIGDLALLGRSLKGRITAFKAGHALHTKFVHLLATSNVLEYSQAELVSK